MIIGEKIAEMRKAKGITQEDLATTIGVSAQTVSKWENSVSMPDIMLLPVIADIFEVSIDTLFDRNIDKNYNLTPYDVYDSLEENFIFIMQKAFYDNNDIITLEQRVQECKKVLESNTKMQSGIYEGKSGAVYFSKETGGVLLAKKSEGWESLFEDESVIKMLRNLSNDSYRNVIHYICSNIGGTYTASSMAKRCEIAIQNAQSAIDTLVEDNILRSDTIEIDNNILYVYRFNNLESKARILMLYISLTYLKRFDKFVSSFYSWCG